MICVVTLAKIGVDVLFSVSSHYRYMIPYFSTIVFLVSLDDT